LLHFSPPVIYLACVGRASRDWEARRCAEKQYAFHSFGQANCLWKQSVAAGVQNACKKYRHLQMSSKREHSHRLQDAIRHFAHPGVECRLGSEERCDG
jgi:hypothetical protein